MEKFEVMSEVAIEVGMLGKGGFMKLNLKIVGTRLNDYSYGYV